MVDLPAAAAWRHLDARVGFEVLFLRRETASACTNALPVHRLGLEVGQEAEAPAVYVRTPDLRVERLEQRYLRLRDEGQHSRYDYAAPAFAYRAELVYDEFGLLLDYPGVAVRVR